MFAVVPAMGRYPSLPIRSPSLPVEPWGAGSTTGTIYFLPVDSTFSPRARLPILPSAKNSYGGAVFRAGDQGDPSGAGGRRHQARRGDRVPLAPARAAHGASDGAVTTESGKGKTRATLNSAVTFETDSAALTPRATVVLDGIVSGWGGTPPASMAVVGHADSVADDAHNQTLSEQRAASVKAYLEGKASGVKIAASGKGETQPAASETNPDGSVSEVGKAANRRVEIRWKK